MRFLVDAQLPRHLAVSPVAQACCLCPTSTCTKCWATKKCCPTYLTQGRKADDDIRIALVPNLQIGNPEGEAPASRDGKLELPILSSQAGAWELAKLAKLANNTYTVTDMTELLSERITMDANICHGKPTIRSLRYPVENILEWLSSGMSVDEILADYEDLEREDILAALEFASRLAKVKRIEMLAA